MIKIDNVDSIPVHAMTFALLSPEKILYEDKHTKTYGNKVAITEILASSSK